MSKKTMLQEQLQFEVVSPDAEGWNDLTTTYVDYRNMENQLVMVLAAKKGCSEYDIAAEIERRISCDVSLDVHKVKKSDHRQLKFRKDKVYYVVDLQTYNPFVGVSDIFQLDE